MAGDGGRGCIDRTPIGPRDDNAGRSDAAAPEGPDRLGFADGVRQSIEEGLEFPIRRTLNQQVNSVVFRSVVSRLLIPAPGRRIWQ